MSTICKDVITAQLTLLQTFLLGDLLDEKTAIVDGYNSYFSFSRGRSGYSGNVEPLNQWCLILKCALILKV